MNGTWLTLGTVGLAAALSELKRGSRVSRGLELWRLSKMENGGGPQLPDWEPTFYQLQRAHDEGGDWRKMEKEAISRRLGKPKARYTKWFDGADTWKLGNLDGEEWLLVDMEDGSYQAVFVTNRGKNPSDLNRRMNFGLGLGMPGRRVIWMTGPGSDRSKSGGADTGRREDIAREELAYRNLMSWLDWYLPIGNSKQSRLVQKRLEERERDSLLLKKLLEEK